MEDAWQTDLESHADFDGRQYLSRNSASDPTRISASKPLVYFGSFQDLLGCDDVGNIKPKNTWLHKVKWDLVVFDEYHFGAWLETAKELFEGEEEETIEPEIPSLAAKGRRQRRDGSGGLFNRYLLEIRNVVHTGCERNSADPARADFDLWPKSGGWRRRPVSSVPAGTPDLPPPQPCRVRAATVRRAPFIP